VQTMLYRRGEVWWYKFRFAGRDYRESTRSKSKAIARAAERNRRQALEEGLHGIRKRSAPIPLSAAAGDWLKLKKLTLAPKSYRIEQINIDKHLKPVLGSLLLTDITAQDIADYQACRFKAGASAGTIRLELGTLRAILRRHRLWADLQPDVKLPPAADDVGKALTADEETKLLDECRKSRSRALYPIVTLALHTGLRLSEIRLLRWKQIDLAARRLVVGKSKTKSGTGRVVPLNSRAAAVLSAWAANFPERENDHFVFASERYGASGDEFTPCVHAFDPSKAMNSLKEAWESAKGHAGVACRFHDLRHTACTRMLEQGVPLSVVGSVLGWSAATTIRMAKRYGHIGDDARMRAVELLAS
jgi:integrase